VLEDYVTDDGETRPAGLVYQVQGPMTYIPRKDEEYLQTIEKVVVKKNEALCLEANNDFVDRNGVERKNGEMWYYDTQGSFWPDVHEEIKKVIKGVILTDKTAIHVMALHDFTDQFGKERKAGTQWLVTNVMTPVFLPSVHEKIEKYVNCIT